MDVHYKAVELVGQGTYGNVFKCRIVHTPGAQGVEYVAIKKFKKSGHGLCQGVTRDDQHVQKLSQGGNKCRRELAILKLISEDGSQNPHLIRLLDHFVTQTNKLCMVFEYIDRTLLDVMDQHPTGMAEQHVKGIIFQVLQGLRQLHETHNLMHRDVKPENVLFDRRVGVVKLCDMGFAREDRPAGPQGDCDWDGEHAQEMTQYVSTRWYRAPELLLRKPRYSKSIDLWSIGCLVVEMLAGKPAFPADNDVGVLGMISDVLGWYAKDGNVRLRDVLQWGDMAHQARSDGQATGEKARRHCMWLKKWLAAQEDDTRDFIMLCLRPNPEERATVHDLLSHSWISGMEWMDTTFAQRIQESMTRTASIQARVMASKRLHMALSSKGYADKEPHRKRQQSMVVSSKSSHLIKPAYFTPQVAGIAALSHNNAQTSMEGSIGAVHATPNHQKKKSNTYWLETPGGGMVSPKLNPTMAVPEESAALIGAVQITETTSTASNAVATTGRSDRRDEEEQPKRSLAKRLLDKLKI